MYIVFFQYVILLLSTLNFLLTFVSNYNQTTLVIKTLSFLILITLFISYAKIKKIKLKISIKKSQIYLTLFIIYLVISLLWSFNPQFGSLKIYQLIIGLLPLIIVFSNYKALFSEINFKYLLYTVFILILILSLIVVFSPPVSFENFTMRKKIFSHVFIGRILIIGIIISLYFILFSDRFKYLMYFSFGLFTIALAQVAFRAGLLSNFFIIVFLLFLFYKQKVVLKRLTLVFSIFMISIIVSLSFTDNLKNRIPNTLTLSDNKNIIKDDLTIKVRLEAIHEGGIMFLNNPLWGNGCGSFNSLSELRQTLKYPHNFFIEILAETGIVGLILSLYVLINLLTHIKKLNPKLSTTFLIIIIYYLILAQFSKDISTNLIISSILFLDDGKNKI